VKISCPTCAAKYSVADEKIQSRLAKIRCRKCSSTIVIDGMTTPANVYIGDPSSPLASGPPPAQETPAAEGAARAGGAAAGAGLSNPAPLASEPVGPAADEYAVDIADNDQRNMTIHQIVGAYNEGLISADTYIWKEGMADWQTLAEVKAVADALHAAARPVAPAAVRRADSGSADLFGRINTAGGEDDITTSAPEPSFSAGTGARNESSVLFSLSALTGSESTAQGSSGKRRTPADDSGLIDLTALTAGETSGGGGFGASASAYGASPLISAPLGGVAGPALGGGLAPGYGTQRSGARTLVIAASMLAVLIIGGAAVFVVNRGSGDTEPTSALEPAPAASPEKARPAEPEPARLAEKTEKEKAEPIAEPAEKEKATETASVKDSVSPDELPTAAPEPAPKPTPRPAPAAAPKPRPPVAAAPARAKPAPPPPAPEPEQKPAPRATPEPDPAAAEAAKKKKAAPRCECAPADLMCAMRCSAKK
jgi:predicted Zn finger-like uncharacterized protein